MGGGDGGGLMGVGAVARRLLEGCSIPSLLEAAASAIAEANQSPYLRLEVKGPLLGCWVHLQGEVAEGARPLEVTIPLGEEGEATVSLVPPRGVSPTLGPIGALLGVALRQQRLALLNAALECAANAIFITDRSGSIEWVNASFLHMSGYTREEVIGRRPSLLRSGVHDNTFFKGVWETILAGKAWEGEVHERHKSGSNYIVHQTITPILGEAGEPTHFIAIHEEITERKRLEAEVRRARDVALESARVKAEFLANMSHEVRTPMNGVLGMLGLLKRTPLSEEQREYIEVAHRSAETLLGSLNDILDYSRLEAGPLLLESIPIDPRRVIGEVIDFLAARAKEKGLVLEGRIDPSVPGALLGDPVRLRQVLLNLAANAVKFTELGRVTLALTSEGGRFRFEVRDTGIGIAPEAQQVIFEPFRQADGSTTRRFGGTGLGLAISRQLVEQMGGELRVDSHPGKGSLFWFSLPLPPAPSPAMGEESLPIKAPTLRKGPPRILVVDDHPTNRRVAEAMLTALGCEVTVVGGGREALAEFDRREFDLVLLDYEMPDMNGAELAAALRARRGGALLIAASAHALDHSDALPIPDVDDRLRKPFDPEGMQRLLARWLDWRSEASFSPEPAPLLLDLTVLARLRALFGEELDNLVTSFENDTTARLEKLRDALARGDSQEGAGLAHAVRGASMNIGARALAELSGRLESALRGNERESGESLLQEVERVYLDTVTRWREGRPPSR